MPDKDLRRRIEELHAELERGEPVDAESKRLLEALTDDIDRVLDPEDEANDTESLADRLAENIRDFEESHPKVAAALGRIATALSNLGI